MTKYEWEKELKRNIHRLPDDEIVRVLEYYNELFEDNIERGRSEREIISEFGYPSDVADKIMSEYDGALKDDDPFDVPPFRASGVTDEKPRAERKAETVFDGHADNPPRKIEITNGNASAGAKSETDDDNSRTWALVAFIVINILTGFAMFFVLGAVWIVLGSLVVAGIAATVAGVAAFVVSFGPIFGGAAASGLAQIGMSIAAVGVGIMLVIGAVALIKLYAKATKKAFSWLLKGVAHE